MKAIVDTNVLVRLIVGDDEAQQKTAIKALDAAASVAVGVHTLCELVWVLDRSYRVSRADIAMAIRSVLGMRNLAADIPAVEAGLAVLTAGGDFADGVIAFEGRRLGGETFVSFDKRAAAAVKAGGGAVHLLA